MICEKYTVLDSGCVQTMNKFPFLPPYKKAGSPPYDEEPAFFIKLMTMELPNSMMTNRDGYTFSDCYLSVSRRLHQKIIFSIDHQPVTTLITLRTDSADLSSAAFSSEVSSSSKIFSMPSPPRIAGTPMNRFS